MSSQRRFRRRMHFGGAWYPARAEACARAIEAFAREAPTPPSQPASGDAAPPHWGVVPHAGWVYSGRVAARVFRTLAGEGPGAGAGDSGQGRSGGVDLVIVLGGHLRPGDPVIAMTEGTWETPFGELAIHEGFRASLGTLPRVRFEDERYNDPDNSTELQLPFVAQRYPDAELLPLRVPPGPMALTVGRLLADYLERTGLRAVGVASTDLTHYGPNYGFEPHGRGESGLRWVTTENDPAYIEAVASGDSERILRVAAERHNACSSGAVAALNEVAQREGKRFEPLLYTTSSDVHPHDRINFVGYLGGVFH